MSLLEASRRYIDAILSGLMLLMGTGCKGALDLPPGESRPYLQSVLQPGDSIQSVWVEVSSPAESSFTPSIHPIDPALVSLSIVPFAGPQVPLVAAALNPGRFDATLPVQDGEQFRVVGTIDGIQITANVTIPGSLVVSDPATDTVHVQGGLSTSLRFRWSSAGASIYIVETVGNGGSLLTAVRDTIGSVQIFRVQDTMALVVRAYEANASEFLFVKTPINRIAGGFGFIGAATQDKRFVVIWD